MGFVISAVRERRARSSGGIIAAIALLLLSGSAVALSPDLTIKQLRHAAWGPNQGAPLGGALGGGVLAQTSDGYLWMVGPAGLFRFDGISFERMELPRDPKLSSLAVYSIFAPRGGGVWVGFTFGGVGFLKDGRWQVYTADDGLPPGTPDFFSEAQDGALWVITSADLARFDGSRWKAVGSDAGLQISSSTALFIDGQGTIWVCTAGAVYYLPSGERRFRRFPVTTQRDPDFVGSISESPEGTVWLDTRDAMVPLVQNPRRATPSTAKHIVFDHDGTLWEGGHRGLHRMERPQHPTLGVAVHKDLVDSYTDTDGLSAQNIYSLLVDREGNVWAGTTAGLDRFSEPRLNAPLRSAEGKKALPAISEIGLAPSDDAGGLWVTNGVDKVLRYKDGELSAPVLSRKVETLLRAPDGTVWIGGTGALWHEQSGRLESVPAPGLRDTQALALDASGHLWASVIRSGVFQLKNGTWTAYGGIDALPRGPAITLTRDHSDRLWFSYPGGTVAVLEGDKVRIYGVADGLTIGNVMANHPGHLGHWLGGERGLARFDRERFQTIRSVAEQPLEGITGIVETESGDLWLNGRLGIVHLPAAELERNRVDPSYPVRGETLGAFDGIVGSADSLRPLPTAIQAGDGKLWFSTTAGFYGIDPARSVHNTTPPPVHIRALTVGDRVLEPQSGLSLPQRTTAVRFDYVGLSLTAAEKVRYRYRLDGVDADWRPLTASRQALYTNLRPGTYTFRVIAANNDGVWNPQGASLAFSIPPAFVQTGWFLALCGAAAALAVSALVRVRVRQVATRVQERLEERMAERERIARDLHDTLLQSFQGLLLRMQTARDLIRTRPDEADKILGSTADQAAEAIAEGRNAVQGLRSYMTEAKDLASTIRSFGEAAAEETGNNSAALRVEVEGTPRRLSPIPQDEVCRIVGEALRNAYRHADANHIGVELRYDKREFRLRVRDDGKGIEPGILSERWSSGHYGLHGMRERARLLGGKLDIWSSPGSGTELELTIPAARIYADSSRPSPSPAPGAFSYFRSKSSTSRRAHGGE